MRISNLHLGKISYQTTPLFSFRFGVMVGQNIYGVFKKKSEQEWAKLDSQMSGAH